jgi:signal transduction histidine kinase
MRAGTVRVGRSVLVPGERTGNLPLAAAAPPARPGFALARWWRRRSVQAQVLAVSFAALLPVLAALVVLTYRIEQMRVAADMVTSTYDALNVGHRLVKQFAEMRMAVNAYALTGSDLFMDQFARARAAWSQVEAAASGSISRDPSREQRLSRVFSDVERFQLDWDDRLSTLQPGSNLLEARARMLEDEKRMRRISSAIAQFVAEEETAITSRLEEAERARNRVFTVAVATCIATVGLLAALTSLLGRSIARPIRRVADAAERLGAGQWEERVAPHGGRETQMLARAFNHMADELQRTQASLDARNRELEQFSARLATVNEDLRDRQREVDDFLYVLSHDLRAPLINIQGFSKRLQGSMEAVAASLAEAPEATKHLARMGESLRFVHLGVTKIDQLIARLLEIARLTTRPDAREWVDMHAVATDVLGACRFQLEERGIEAAVDPLPRVFGDPVQLNQVLTNLIDNAIKYMGDRPTKRIAVGCTQDGDRYRFAVSDTGPGIAPKDRDKVFRMFTRLDPGATQGEGIGLAAVRAIVNRHGGRIWVESTPDVGSTFYFTLPQQPAAAS